MRDPGRHGGRDMGSAGCRGRDVPVRQTAFPGSVTVGLALVTGILFSVILTLLEASRRDLIRMQVECAADMAMDSALAQFHREMFLQYGLFFIDTSYGSGDPCFQRTEEQISQYLGKNCSPAKTFHVLARDILGLTVEGVELLTAGVATDDDCQVLKYHVVQYQKDRYGISAAQRILGLGQGVSGYSGEGIEGQWDALQGELKQEIAEKRQLQKENQETSGEEGNGQEEDPIPETPSDVVSATRSEGILGAATSGFPLSGAVYPSRSAPSARACIQGTGLTSGKGNALGALEKGLLVDYILKHCGRFGEIREGGALDYEVEYILQGKDSDRDNLEQTLREILLMRETANAAFLFSSNMKGPAQTVGTVIAGILFMPELAELITAVILFAWAYAESVKDVRILAKGDKVALIKDQNTWNTPFSQLLTYRSSLDSYRSAENGQNYRDYLAGLLLLRNTGKAVWGLADMMEGRIRKTQGNGNFRLDGLIDGFCARAYVSSSYGGSWSIERTYCYE